MNIDWSSSERSCRITYHVTTMLTKAPTVRRLFQSRTSNARNARRTPNPGRKTSLRPTYTRLPRASAQLNTGVGTVVLTQSGHMRGGQVIMPLVQRADRICFGCFFEADPLVARAASESKSNSTFPRSNLARRRLAVRRVKTYVERVRFGRTRAS